MEDLVFEHNRAWHNLVVLVPMPKYRRSNEEVKEELDEEMQQWNPTCFSSVKGMRILCRPEMLWRQMRGSLLISFEAKEEYKVIIHEGIYVYGERCQAMPYKPRHVKFTSPNLGSKPGRQEAD
jgi:predicted HAD superfamily hydrolase